MPKDTPRPEPERTLPEEKAEHAKTKAKLQKVLDTTRNWVPLAPEKPLIGREIMLLGDTPATIVAVGYSPATDDTHSFFELLAVTADGRLHELDAEGVRTTTYNPEGE